MKNYDSHEYKRSRTMYIAQCAVDYFMLILASDSFLAKLLTEIGINDALIGCVSSGGALMDMGIHAIDLLQYISQTTAKTLACFSNNNVFKYSVDDSSALLMKMDNGATAFVDANFNIPDNAAKCRLEFYGTKGSILAENTVGQIEDGTILLTTSNSDAAYDAQQNREDKSYEEVEITNKGNMYEKEISSFSNAIINDTDPEITSKDGILVQTIVEKAYLASQEGVYKNI